MAKEYATVDLWIGHFPTEAALAAYLVESYSDDDSAPISRLAADMGEQFYDHDFLERSFHESPSRDIRSRLSSHSFSRSYLAAAAVAFDRASLPDFNTILLAWGSAVHASYHGSP